MNIQAHIKTNAKPNRPANHGKRSTSPLGEFLKQWSTENGVTRANLADSLNMRPTKLSDLMTTRQKLTPELRIAILATTGISPSVLDHMIPTREPKALTKAQAVARDFESPFSTQIPARMGSTPQGGN